MNEEILQLIKNLQEKHANYPLDKEIQQLAFIRNIIVRKNDNVYSLANLKTQMMILTINISNCKDNYLKKFDEQDITDISKIIEAFESHIVMLTLTNIDALQ